MTTQLDGYLVPDSFRQFTWHKYVNQKDESVTYIYLIKPPIYRLRGQSSVLYIGKTEQPICKRYKQEMYTKNTLVNSQATNIRMSHVSQLLLNRNDKIEMFFTHNISFLLFGEKAKEFGNILQFWNKSHYQKFFIVDDNGNAEVSIEKYLITEYAKDHWEVPPLNNSG
jgi:hypothetical protein